jgi:hypothetical protein
MDRLPCPKLDPFITATSEYETRQRAKPASQEKKNQDKDDSK